MRKPIIGIVGKKIINSKGGFSYGIPGPYWRWLSMFGRVKMINFDEYDDTIDVLVLPGGADVYPLRYKEIPQIETGYPDIYMEYFDIEILPKYVNNPSIHIFGICRGLQTLAVHFGLKLDQDISQEYSDTSRDKRVDTLEFVSLNLLQVNLQKHLKKNKKYQVNSLHHQAVNDSEFIVEIQEGLATNNDIVLVAKNKDFGNVEILDFSNCTKLKYYSKSIVGVQYHPEELLDDLYSNYTLRTMCNIAVTNTKNKNTSREQELAEVYHKEVERIKREKIVKDVFNSMSEEPASIPIPDNSKDSLNFTYYSNERGEFIKHPTLETDIVKKENKEEEVDLDWLDEKIDDTDGNEVEPTLEKEINEVPLTEDSLKKSIETIFDNTRKNKVKKIN